MTRTKLPADFGNSIFTDSPLRSTQPRRVALISEAEPSSGSILPSDSRAPSHMVSPQTREPEEGRLSSETAPQQAVQSTAVEAASKESSKRKKLGEQIKITAYFSKSQITQISSTSTLVQSIIYL